MNKIKRGYCLMWLTICASTEAKARLSVSLLHSHRIMPWFKDYRVLTPVNGAMFVRLIWLGYPWRPTQARFVVSFLRARCGRGSSPNQKREHRRSKPRLSNHSKTPLFAFNRTFSLSLFRKFRSSVNLYRVVLDFISFAVIGNLRLEGYSSHGFLFFDGRSAL